MAPNSSSPSPPPAVEAASGALTRRELLATLGVGLALAGLAAGLAYYGGRKERAALAPTPLDHPRRIVPFQLTERSGRAVSQAELAGKVLVVDFVFSSCSLSCRAVNDRMAEIQSLVADRPDVVLLSLTVDPRTDSPEVLSRFAAEFHADPTRWLFLTGEKSAVYELLETSFLHHSEDPNDPIPGGFAGTDRIMVVDREGNVRGSFNGLNAGIARAVVAEIDRLRKTS